METEIKRNENLRLVTDYCLSSDSTSPIKMADTIMSFPEIPMIGAIHHPLIAGALVTAYRNAGGKAGNKEIEDAIKRGSTIPAGFCAFYGADGAAIACGIAVSSILGTTPLAQKDVERSIAHMMTSRALSVIANNRGARCCKRSTWDVLSVATQYFRETLGVEFEQVPASELKCQFYSRYRHCNRQDCRYFPESP